MMLFAVESTNNKSIKRVALASNEFILLSEQNSLVRGNPRMPLATVSIALRQKCDLFATAYFYAMGFREFSLTSEFVGLYPQIHCSLRRDSPCLIALKSRHHRKISGGVRRQLNA
jgi:hypothetical protein